MQYTYSTWNLIKSESIDDKFLKHFVTFKSFKLFNNPENRIEHETVLERFLSEKKSNFFGMKFFHNSRVKRWVTKPKRCEYFYGQTPIAHKFNFNI